MSAELSVHQGMSMEPAALHARMNYAEKLSYSGLIPRHFQGQPANVLVAVETGAALGIPAVHALSGITVINGRATLSADLMAAVVRRAGHKLRIREDQQNQTVTATLIRADDPDYEYTATWNVAKAQQAGLWGGGAWNKYPLQMMRARAISEVVRQGASEALFGVIYTPEEMGAVVDESGEIVHQDQPPAEAPQNETVTAEIVEEPQQSAQVTDDQLLALTNLKQQLGMDDKAAAEAVMWATNGRTYRAAEMTTEEADQLAAAMTDRLHKNTHQEGEA